MTDHERGPESDTTPLGRLLDGLLASINEGVERGTHEVDPFQRDPEFVRSLIPFLKLADWYFSVDLRGWENLPEEGPFLIVGNHSGGVLPVDPWPFLVNWVEERGAEAPLYSLTYDLDFGNPLVGSRLMRLGMIPASHDNARRAFEQQAPVIVFPGGDYEVFRPWTERNRIEFGGRKGFIRLALRAGVPIVPMTIHGAHESTLVLTRGSGLAHAVGLDKLQVKVFPFIWNIPLGIAPGFVPSIQLPAKVTIQLGECISWDDLGPDDAEDENALQRCYEHVTGTMQDTLDALARETPYPVLTRMAELRPDRVIARGLRSWLR